MIKKFLCNHIWCETEKPKLLKPLDVIYDLIIFLLCFII